MVEKKLRHAALPWKEWDTSDWEWMVGYRAKGTTCLCSTKALNLRPCTPGSSGSGEPLSQFSIAQETLIPDLLFFSKMT